MSATSINIHWWWFWKDCWLTDGPAQFLLVSLQILTFFCSPWGNWQFIFFRHKTFWFSLTGLMLSHGNYLLDFINQSDAYWIIALSDSLEKLTLLFLIILTPLELVDMTEEVWHKPGTFWAKRCIQFDVFMYVFNLTIMCCSLAVVPVIILIFCVTMTVPETDIAVYISAITAQCTGLTPRTRILICGRWSWGRGRGSPPSWGPPPPSPCRWSPDSRSEAGSGDQSPPRHTPQHYHHWYPDHPRKYGFI